MKRKWICFPIIVILTLLLISPVFATNTISPAESPVETNQLNELPAQNISEVEASQVIEDDQEKGQSEPLDFSKVITSVGIIITAFIGILTWAATIRKMYIDGITKNRVQWIDSVRNITAKIVCFDSRSFQDDAQLQTALCELQENAYMLSLYLNVQGPFDRVILDYLAAFLKSQKKTAAQQFDDGKFIHNRRMLNLAMQIYLKAEWNRIKKENKFFYFPRYDEKKSILGILSSLSDDYVEELKKKYNEYLTGKALKAPVFTEYIDMGPIHAGIGIKMEMSSLDEK